MSRLIWEVIALIGREIIISNYIVWFARKGRIKMGKHLLVLRYIHYCCVNYLEIQVRYHRLRRRSKSKFPSGRTLHKLKSC